MATRVVWVPGILGSGLSVLKGGGGFRQPVWVDPIGLLSGGIVDLQLGPDGASPGPLTGGDTVSVDGIYIPAYGALPTFLEQLGYSVLRLGYDWRRDLVSVAAFLWPTVAAWAAGQPFALVAHSLGGLLARALYGQALAAGAGGQVAAIITIGTPHFGSMEAVRLWWRLPILYRGLSQLCGWGSQTFRGAGQDWLDATLASMPSWYELLPWFAAGPLWQTHPDQAFKIYQLSFYAGGPNNGPANTHLTASWFQLAQIVQGELAGWNPAGLVTSIASVGVRTPDALDPTGTPDTDAGYTHTDLGDGIVTLAQASPPGGRVLLAATPHALQCYDPAILGLLPALIGF